MYMRRGLIYTGRVLMYMRGGPNYTGEGLMYTGEGLMYTGEGANAHFTPGIHEADCEQNH